MKLIVKTLLKIHERPNDNKNSRKYTFLKSPNEVHLLKNTIHLLMILNNNELPPPPTTPHPFYYNTLNNKVSPIQYHMERFKFDT